MQNEGMKDNTQNSVKMWRKKMERDITKEKRKLVYEGGRIEWTINIRNIYRNKGEQNKTKKGKKVGR